MQSIAIFAAIVFFIFTGLPAFATGIDGAARSSRTCPKHPRRAGVVRGKKKPDSRELSHSFPVENGVAGDDGALLESSLSSFKRPDPCLLRRHEYLPDDLPAMVRTLQGHWIRFGFAA